jgi:hypothetical protein
VLGAGVGNLQDYLARLLIECGCREDARKGVAFQLGGEYLLAIQLGEDAVAHYLQLDIVPLAGFNLAWTGSHLTLGTIHDRLHTVLGIVPATKVQPAVVVLIHVVEDDEETLVAGILFRAYLIYITVAGNLARIQTDAALLVAGLLDEAALSLPLSADVGRQLLHGHWQCLAVLIAVALVLERYLGAPCSHSHTADGWLHLGLLILVWILLVHLQYTGTDVVRHHVLNVVRWSSEYLIRCILNHIRCPHTVVEVGEDWSVGCHGHDVGVVLDAHHIDSLTECCIERTHIAEALGYGIFAYINLAADGGLYAELISNRSFEDDDKNIPTWKTSAQEGAKIQTQLINKGLLNNAQGKALQLTIAAKPAATASLINEGFWGINAVQGRTYKLSFWAKGSYKGGLKARLTNAKGDKVYAETALNAKVGKKWTKYTAELTANANDAKAQFELVADGKGTIILDVVSLFPPTFKNRENGLRPDLAQLLYNIHPKFVRFPGGCYVEGQESPENAFHWEKTIGPIEERPGHKNVNWRYRTSDGMGFDEYLQLAEDLNAKPLYVVNVGLWHGGMTPVDSIQPWIDECMNALEYANGPVTSKYGALRAKNGHPEPYNIEYLEIGNENNQPDPRQQSDHYYERFKKFKDAVLAKYPKMHLIGNVVAWGDDNPKWESQENVELLDEHYYRNPAWFAENFNKYDNYDRKGSEIYVGEYAVTQGFGNMGSLDAALGEAVYMMGIENNSDIVTMASFFARTLYI